MEPDYFMYTLLNFSEVLKVSLIILEMRNCRLRKFNSLGTKSYRKGLNKNLNVCLLIPNMCTVLYTWCHVSLTHEMRLSVSWVQSLHSNLYITHPLLNVSTQCPHLGWTKWWSQAACLWAFDALILSLLWTCWVIMDRLWALPLALSFSISRVGNDPNPTPRNCVSDWFTCL